MTAVAMIQDSLDPGIEEYYSSLNMYYSQVVAMLSDGGIHRFNELKKKWKKLSSNTLSSVLKRLTSEGIVNRLVIPTSSPRTEYSLTEKGMELSRINAEYLEWLRRWHLRESE